MTLARSRVASRTLPCQEPRLFRDDARPVLALLAEAACAPAGSRRTRRLAHHFARHPCAGEDLEAFAGAGLYESVPAVPLKENAVSYSYEPLVWDEGFRTELLDRISRLGSEVEAAFGGVPQDIEGAVSNGQLFVVQSRPEVIH